MIKQGKIQSILKQCSAKYELPHAYVGELCKAQFGNYPTQYRIEIRDTDNRNALAVVWLDTGALKLYYDDTIVELDSEESLNKQLNYFRFLYDVRAQIMLEGKS